MSLLVACTDVPIKSGEHFKVLERAHLYKLKHWSFDGRLSLSNGQESWSASIAWNHTEGRDEIKLAGPLGQGATLIVLTNDWVSIDRGDGKIAQSTQVDAFVQQQLGMLVPVRALRYWVLGLTHPDSAFVEREDGFEQSKWAVHYLQMQQLDSGWMPRKIGVEQDEAKLKLIVEQWTL
jgi:outer membrane lipoprotein LolB